MQISNQGKWRHLVGKFGTNAVSATWWSKLGGSRYATRAFATPIFVASATPIFVASATPYFRISATQTAATPKILF